MKFKGLLFCSIIFLCLGTSLAQNQAVRWKITAVKSTMNAASFPINYSLDMGTIGRQGYYCSYSFVNFSANACLGNFKCTSNNQITFNVADCTEACCNTDDEENLMRLFTDMSSYEQKDSILILSGNLKHPVIFKEHIGGPDTLLGETQLFLKKVK